MLTIVSDSCETALSPFEDRYVDVCTFRTRFWQAGSGGSAVVLLAGIGCSVLEWQNNVAALAARHRVYAFDMLGHGLTDFGDSVADADDGSLSGRVEKTPATLVNDPAALAADGDGVVLAKISGE